MTRKLNAPREIPYAFRVVAFDEWVWLYDDSERSFICDTAREEAQGNCLV